MVLTERFADLVHRADFALDEAALLIAAHGDPSCDVAESLGALDALAAQVPRRDLDAVIASLFGVGGFCGDRIDYYNPRNSYLHAVIDRRRGIPISLSVLLIEVARRCGVPLVGISTPGHFLVRDATDPGCFIDPFAGGRLLDRAGVEALFTETAPGVDMAPHLVPAAPVDVVRRMLANLVDVHRRRGDRRGLLWASRLRALLPGASAADRRMLGGALAACGDFAGAAGVLDNLVADGLAVDPERELGRSRRLRARLN